MGKMTLSATRLFIETGRFVSMLVQKRSIGSDAPAALRPMTALTAGFALRSKTESNERAS
jgi:hypothetical protein